MEYQRPSSLKPTSSGFCPGCMHSLATKLIADVLDDMGQQENSVHVVPVGCATLNLAYWKGDLVGAAHGRAPAVATGFKRTNPDRLVFAYQGDGDCAAIGLAEIMGAANRGENFTVIFFNNQTYGMTGGQMAPTTLMGMKTSTCPYGRQADLHGFPLKITEIAATLEGTCYVTRQAVHTVAAINRTKRAIRRAFQNSLEHRGTSLVEVVSTCSSGWKKTPVEANQWMEEHMFPFYPLGDLKTEDQKK